MVIAVDPDAADRWYCKGLRERDVTAYPAPDGTITLSVNGLPADAATAACERIQRIAAAAKRAGHPGRIGQIRCDLVLGLLDGRFTGLTHGQVVAALIADHGQPGCATPGRPGDTGPQPRTADPDTMPDGRPSTDGRAGTGPADRPADGPADRPDDRPDDDPDGPDDNPDGPDDGPDGPDIGPPDDGPDNHPDGSPHVGPDARPEGRSHDQRVGIEIRVELGTLLGLNDNPGEIPGVALLLAPDARLRVALQHRAQWRFAVTAEDGTLLSEGVTRRRPTHIGGDRPQDGPPGGIVELHVPGTLLTHLAGQPATSGPWTAVVADIATQHNDRERRLADLDTRPHDRLPHAALRRHTEIRDRTCTFAGVCRRRAHTSDIDHSREHAHGGATVRDNVGPLCEPDHGLRHRAGWTVTQPEPGRFLWRSPLGGEYQARGEFLLPEMPAPAPADPGPSGLVPIDFDSPPPPWFDEGPILRRPPPPRPQPPLEAEVAPQLPDEPPF